MKIQALNIENYRCFEKAQMIFSKEINVLIGANSSGKTSILKCILELQQPNLSSLDLRNKQLDLVSNLVFSDGWIRNEGGQEMRNFTSAKLVINRNALTKILLNNQGGNTNFNYNIRTEPNTLIYPFLSKRKTNGFDQTINKNTATSVRDDLFHLNAKIDRLADSGHPKYSKYRQACEEILGFFVHCQASDSGKQAGILVNDFDFITIESMGEGVGNLLGMIVNLCVAENKIFLIEELENDIHPKALKSLLDLIIESSKTNQFFISTHSNIVLSRLGAIPNTKIFNLSSKIINRTPTAEIHECYDVEERRKALEDLGYELGDFGLWKGWLILEESSAESIINSFLIPWFAPNLIGKLRTFSSRGYTRAKEKFDKLHEQFLYLHLTPIYKNKAWIIFDQGEKELIELEKLKEIYVRKHNWNEDNFIQLSKHDFESYYPHTFSEESQVVIAAAKENKQKAKEELLLKVISWINENSPKARLEFETSAAEIVGILRKIEKSLN